MQVWVVQNNGANSMKVTGKHVQELFSCLAKMASSAKKQRLTGLCPWCVVLTGPSYW
jgi:hypothetical protein